MRRARTNPTASPAARTAARAYTALHDGLDPGSVRMVKADRPPKWKVKVGRVKAIEYEKEVDDDGDGVPNATDELYRHEFSRDEAPDIDFDDRRQLHFTGGRYAVTERGITDMSRRRNRHSKRMFSFIPRVNPDYTTGQILVRGTGLALLAVGVNKTYDTLLDPFFATDRTRSLVKGALGIAVGLGFAKMKYPFIAAGFVAAGVLEIAQLGYRTFGLDAYEAMARDRVAAWATRMRAPATPPPPPPPGGGPTGDLRSINAGVGDRVTAGQLSSADGRAFMPDPMEIRKQMASNA